MLAIITKASDDYYYELKEVSTIEDLFKIYNHGVIVEPNPYTYTDSIFFYWDGMKKEDMPLVRKAECHITIYDDYIE